VRAGNRRELAPSLARGEKNEPLGLVPATN
jgi:hypothetical protein